MTSPTLITKPQPLLLDLDKIPRIEKEDSRMTVFLKGPPKVGKTELAHSFPSPIFSIYADPNRGTITALMKRGQEIEARRVTSWLQQFSSIIVPAVTNRRIKAETIVVDTIDFLFEMLLRDLKGTRSGLTQQDWGTVLDKATEATLALVNSAQPIRNPDGSIAHPGYNIVFTCHEKKVTDEAGNVTDIAPSIKGQFRDNVEAFFDYVLICKKTVKAIPQQGAPALKQRVFQLYTVPPSPAETCGAPAHWPALIEIPAGTNGYDKLRECFEAEPLSIAK